MKLGFALLELIMVLAIAAIIILFGIHQYHSYRQKQNLIALSHNIQNLYQALNEYYQQNCKTNKEFHPTLKDLPQSVLSNLIHTPIATHYQVNAHKLTQTKRSNKDVYQLIVTATLNVPSTLLTWYQQKLGATSLLQHNTLQWIYMPSYPMNTISSELWVLNASLRNYKEQVLKENQNNGGLPDDQSCAY